MSDIYAARVNLHFIIGRLGKGSYSVGGAVSVIRGT